MLDLDAVQASLPSPTPITLLPTLNPTQISPALHPTGSRTVTPGATLTPACVNRAEFLKHLTIADNTAIEGGDPFTKMWQVENTGTCIWTSEYTLRYYSGEMMSGTETIQLSRTVAPGETVDIRLNLIAPMEISTYTSSWVLSDPNGQIFGMGPDGQHPLSLVIQVKPTPRPTPG